MQEHAAMRLWSAVCLTGCLLPACLAQAVPDQGPLPRLSVAVSVGTLGAGIQVGTAVQRRVNVRGGLNYFSYSLSGSTSDNLGYSGSLRLESVEALVDFFPVKWLHLSGGALLYDGFQGNGRISVPGGQSFSLNGATYYSSPSDPVNGTGKFTVREAAPAVLFGFGNLLPRNGRHFTASSDFGVAFQGSPDSTLNLLGSTCAAAIGPCAPISAQPLVQANVVAEQSKIDKDLKPLNFWPILRVNIGYRF